MSRQSCWNAVVMTSSTGPPDCACAGVGQGKHRERIVFSAMVYCWLVGWCCLLSLLFCPAADDVLRSSVESKGRGFDVWDGVSVW